MWICDDCQQPIEKPEDGFLEWLMDSDLEDYNYRIVHKKSSCPIAGGDCYVKGRSSYTYDLACYCGAAGLRTLLDMFKQARDPEELAEIIKRIHVPGYEDSR